MALPISHSDSPTSPLCVPPPACTTKEKDNNLKWATLIIDLILVIIDVQEMNTPQPASNFVNIIMVFEGKNSITKHHMDHYEVLLPYDEIHPFFISYSISLVTVSYHKSGSAHACLLCYLHNPEAKVPNISVNACYNLLIVLNSTLNSKRNKIWWAYLPRENWHWSVKIWSIPWSKCWLSSFFIRATRKDLNTCIIRWYRAGENWNPTDCSLTAILVVG